MENSHLDLPILIPDPQISLYYRLKEQQDRYLQALQNTVLNVDIKTINKELVQMVSDVPLKLVATFGIRGECFFPVPCIISTSPALIGYYRLLLGLSQKEFYDKGKYGRFIIMEEENRIPEELLAQIPQLCKSLIRTAELLVDGLDDLSLNTIHELQLLTLEQQLHGSQNTLIDDTATKEVYELICDYVQPYAREGTKRSIRIKNESGRNVLIAFSSDSDISVTMFLESRIRPLVSIEIKGGTDASNIHNRLGEAEKSHLKAKQRGFFEFWTILRVDIEYAVAKRESPTSSHFFHIDRIKNPQAPEFREFRELLSSLLGIRNLSSRSAFVSLRLCGQ